jgi:hypothetical protein
MRHCNDLLNATREPRFIDRIADRVLIVILIFVLGGMCGASVIVNS